MKDISKKLTELLREGYCAPQIGRLAKKLKEPSSTIHYNIKKLEKDGVVSEYTAVFDHKKLEEGFTAFVLINLSPTEYGDPERLAREFSKFREIESVDIITGDWELLLKIRTKDQDAYYDFVKRVISRKGVEKIKTLTSLKEVKSEFIAHRA